MSNVNYCRMRAVKFGTVSTAFRKGESSVDRSTNVDRDKMHFVIWMTDSRALSLAVAASTGECKLESHDVSRQKFCVDIHPLSFYLDLRSTNNVEVPTLAT